MLIKMAGQDITRFVDELSVDIKDDLGQGPGTTAGSVGRTSTCQFTTTLGPANSAVGAGASISSPQLVRQGEVQVYDQFSNLIYGGFAGKLTDNTDRTQPYTLVECFDYYQSLDTIIVNETYTGFSDVQIISSLVSKYAPWVSLAAFPTTPNLLFGPMVLRNISLQKAIQKVVDAVGFIIWVDYNKILRYMNPENAPLAPFSLSTSPNFTTSFDVEVESLELDDTAVINRVYFYGGHRITNDYTQYLSNQADGQNKTFMIPYFPHRASDGNYHLKINGGADKVLGFAAGTTTKGQNTLKPLGICDAILDTNARAIQWAVAPPKGSIVTFVYRYETPLTVIITDQASRQFFGKYFDSTISDNTVVDVAVAVQRCRTLLLENSMGLATLKAWTWHGTGLSAGQLINVFHSVRGINEQYLIQEVHPLPQGGGKFKYELTLGAWSWNLTDIFVHLAQAAVVQDNQDTEQTATTNATQYASNFALHDSFAQINYSSAGNYYASASFVGDGKDAFPGFSTI